MKTSANGRAFIEAFEGKFLHTYDDGTGVLTIGYGHTTVAGLPAVHRGMSITDEECDSILASDLEKVEAQVNKLITASLYQDQFDALVSFQFNTGGLKTSIAGKINNGDVTGAMNTLLQYDHAGGRVMAGLTRRRKAEKLFFMGDIAEAFMTAGAHLVLSTVPVIVPMPQEVDGPVPESIPEDDGSVRWLQERLNRKGAHLTVDNDYGPSTMAAVRAYQKFHPPLRVDGFAGPKTRQSLAS